MFYFKNSVKYIMLNGMRGGGLEIFFYRNFANVFTLICFFNEIQARQIRKNIINRIKLMIFIDVIPSIQIFSLLVYKYIFDGIRWVENVFKS